MMRWTSTHMATMTNKLKNQTSIATLNTRRGSLSRRSASMRRSSCAKMKSITASTLTGQRLMTNTAMVDSCLASTSTRSSRPSPEVLRLHLKKSDSKRNPLSPNSLRRRQPKSIQRLQFPCLLLSLLPKRNQRQTQMLPRRQLTRKSQLVRPRNLRTGAPSSTPRQLTHDSSMSIN